MPHRPAVDMKYPFVEAAIDLVADWWHKPAAASRSPDWGSEDLGELAHEMAVTPSELQLLFHAYPALSALMMRRKGLLAFRRMLELRLDPAEVSQGEPTTLRAVKERCMACDFQVPCQSDLASRPHDEAWKSYCPNAGVLASTKLH